MGVEYGFCQCAGFEQGKTEDNRIGGKGKYRAVQIVCDYHIVYQYGTLSFGGYYLNKKKKSNKSGYPDEAIKTLARCFYPSMVEFFNSEEGQREYEEWLKEQEALQALPVAA